MVSTSSPLARIGVFCGSSPGDRPIYEEQAIALGQLLAAQGVELVYGGGAVGLMGAVANATLAAGGSVIGVIPEGLFGNAVEHHDIPDLRLVGSMHERKALMYDLSDAFIALPGGLGTLEELAEALTWVQIGLHDKPVGLLDVDGFYQPLLSWFETARAGRFLRPENLEALRVSEDPATLIDALRTPAGAQPPKWQDG